jgi:hypothetical protein
MAQYQPETFREWMAKNWRLRRRIDEELPPVFDPNKKINL